VGIWWLSGDMVAYSGDMRLSEDMVAQLGYCGSVEI
jgi:hypothetical protein